MSKLKEQREDFQLTYTAPVKVQDSVYLKKTIWSVSTLKSSNKAIWKVYMYVYCDSRFFLNTQSCTYLLYSQWHLRYLCRLSDQKAKHLVNCLSFILYSMSMLEGREEDGLKCVWKLTYTFLNKISKEKAGQF